jgi:catecholate siderophore receptor
MTCTLLLTAQYRMRHYIFIMQVSCNKSPFLSTLALVFSFCPLQAQLEAQNALGQTEFHATVLDPSNAPLEGARVTFERAGKAAAQTTADQNGQFSVKLDPGSYTLTIEADGFAKISEQITVTDQPMQGREFILSVAGRQDTVTVMESPGYVLQTTSSATKTLTPLRDIPQSITVVTQELMRNQLMMSIGDVVRYVPGVVAHQGENNRDQVVIRGNNSSADFFVNGVRDDTQYFRDLYNLERVEVLKGPNAMIFGRGGGGGVVNRVTKEAGFMPLREIALTGGSFSNKRIAGDYNRSWRDMAAIRLNSIYENSNSFRDFVNLERYGVSPTATFMPSAFTKFTVSYEFFRDGRTADRGIPSYQGLPSDIRIATFFGNPDDSYVRARVNLVSGTVDHQFRRLSLRNRTLFGDYDRAYRNYVPGAVTADKTQTALSAYDSATQRQNVFNQTDLTSNFTTGWIRHTFLAGAELGRQQTDNLRNTGYFNNTATSIMIPYANPVISSPATFRQSATDANNSVALNLGATYLQDQMRLSRYIQIVAGVRLDHFDLRFHNNRNNDNLRRIDNLVSPRLGLVLKPVDVVSVYASYSVSYLPSSGDQFASLTNITRQVKPEKFTNYELGLKWDISRSFAFTTAVYRLDRTNTRSVDPNDPTRILQTGSQRTDGYELGVNGNLTRKWRIAGGYAYQDAFIMNATAAAPAGVQVAQVPHHTLSLWNYYQVLRRWGGGVGVVQRSDMYAGVDNTVTLPGYARVDAAVFYSFTEKIRLQANVENIGGITYYANANGNNNISPGFPRAIRLGLTARF